MIKFDQEDKKLEKGKSKDFFCLMDFTNSSLGGDVGLTDRC